MIPVEFSKKITALSWAVALILTTAAIVLPIFGIPIDGIHTALPYSWGEVAAVQGFYLWKSKNENRHKYAMKYVDTVAEKYGIDIALRIAEIVLKN